MLIRRVVFACVVTALVAGGCSSGDDGAATVPDRTTTTHRAVTDRRRRRGRARPRRSRPRRGATCSTRPSACCRSRPTTSRRADADTDTGRRVALPTGQLANTSGVTLDPTEWNRNDGFSPGTPVLLSAPGVDLDEVRLPPQGDIGASMRRRLGDRSWSTSTPASAWPTGPSSTPTPGPGDAAAADPPGAAVFPQGHRIAVGFRPLRDASGAELEPSVAFRAYRDGLETDIDEVEARRADMEDVFDGLGAAGVDRADLTLAWSFTVAIDREPHRPAARHPRRRLRRPGRRRPGVHRRRRSRRPT